MSFEAETKWTNPLHESEPAAAASVGWTPEADEPEELEGEESPEERHARLRDERSPPRGADQMRE